MMQRIIEIYNEDRTRKVVFYKCGENAISFVEEIRLENQARQDWEVERLPVAFCGPFDAAMREARSQLEWLDAAVVKIGLFRQDSQFRN